MGCCSASSYRATLSPLSRATGGPHKRKSKRRRRQQNLRARLAAGTKGGGRFFFFLGIPSYLRPLPHPSALAHSFQFFSENTWPKTDPPMLFPSTCPP